MYPFLTASFASIRSDSQSCSFTIREAGTLEVLLFNTVRTFFGGCEDTLTVGGRIYCSTSGPNDVAVNAGDTIEWSSDFSDTRSGAH